MAALSIASHLTKALKAQTQDAFLQTPQTLQAHLTPLIALLNSARPTAVNLGAAMRQLTSLLNTLVEQGADTNTIAQALIAEAIIIEEEDVARNKEMSKWGGEWLIKKVKARGESGDKLNVMTVCNTGSLATSVSSGFCSCISHKI